MSQKVDIASTNAIRPLISGNWKMNGLAAQLYEIKTIAAFVNDRPPAADVLICLPATLLYRAVQEAAGRLDIGGEDSHAEASGSFTGDISAGRCANPHPIRRVGHRGQRQRRARAG